jgi:multiple sugar transport system substrate-binding protein
VGELAFVLLKAAQNASAYAISFNRTPALYWLPFAWSWGGRGLSDVQRPADLWRDVKTCQGIQFYVDLVHKHHLAPSRQAAGTTPMTDRFLAGQLAMMINGRWAVPILREKAKFAWTVAPFPQGPAGSRVGVDSAGYAVSAFSRHPQAALALARFLTSPDAMAAFAQSGLVIPARKAIMPADGVARRKSSATRPPRHGGLLERSFDSPFIEALETGVPTQTGPRWHRLSEALNQSLEPVWESGKIKCDGDD